MTACGGGSPVGGPYQKKMLKGQCRRADIEIQPVLDVGLIAEVPSRWVSLFN
jgi:hypothetical protein